MKKITLFFSSIVLLSLLTAPAFGLLKVSGMYTSFTGTDGTLSGYGAELQIPLPFLDLRLSAAYSDPYTIASLPAVGSFAGGSIAVNIVPVALNLRMGIPFLPLPIYIGGEYGYTIAGSNDLAIPGGTFYGYFAGLQMDILPLISVFAQYGYSTLALDIEEALRQLDSTIAASGVVRRYDFAGNNMRAGVTIGF